MNQSETKGRFSSLHYLRLALMKTNWQNCLVLGDIDKVLVHCHPNFIFIDFRRKLQYFVPKYLTNTLLVGSQGSISNLSPTSFVFLNSVLCCVDHQERLGLSKLNFL